MKFSKGSIVKIGKYYLDNSGIKKDLDWIVLKEEKDRVLLLTRQVIDAKAYDDAPVLGKEWEQRHKNKDPLKTGFLDVYWCECTLHEWLNHAFFDLAFSETEKRNIIETRIITQNAKRTISRSPNDEIIAGPSVVDRVFCLSVEEVEEIFGVKRVVPVDSPWGASAPNAMKEIKQIEATGTDYANSHGLYYAKNGPYWWLRSPGGANGMAAIIMYGNYLYRPGEKAKDETIGVRPAIWVKKDFFTSDSLKNFDFFFFGEYNGNKIEWIVLDNEYSTKRTSIFHSKKKAILALSKDIIDCQPFARQDASARWEKSFLRKWLNSSFCKDAFSNRELAILQPVLSEASVNPMYPSDQTKRTSDIISLLSAEQAIHYFSYSNTTWFSNNSETIAFATSYAKEQGLQINPETGAGRWWLRTPGPKVEGASGLRNIIRTDTARMDPATGMYTFDTMSPESAFYTSYVGSDGRLRLDGNLSTRLNNGVRPVIVLDREQLISYLK